MMKKTALLTLLLLNSCLLFAQKTDTVKRRISGIIIKSSDDVITNASQLKELSKFIYLLDKAGLTDTLKTINPITVFAPDNNAFSNTKAASYDSLSKPQLTKLLRCYIVAGKITSKDILNQIHKNNGQAILTTLSGSTFTATIDANRNIVLTDQNGDQSIIRTFDIQQKNGILDIITATLFPLKPPG